MKKLKSLKGKVLAFLFTSALLCMSKAPVHAASGYSDYTSVEGFGRVGVVDIELHQDFPAEMATLTPGQTVPIESAVENKGQPAWIRVKLEYPASEGGLQELDDSLITFADESWTKIGPYYYLTEAVGTGKTVLFTESVRFPSDWDNTMMDATMSMAFTAEAIQEKNFEPDFDSDDPWHGAVIEALDSDRPAGSEDDSGQLSVVYENGVEGMVHFEEGFGEGLGSMMPGDVYEGEATIENRMNLPVKLYFDMDNSGNEELLKILSIKITNGGDVVYEGPMSGSVKPARMLKEYQTGDRTTFTYQITAPADMDNNLALTDFKSKLTFSAQEIVQPEEKPTIPEIIKEIIATGDRSMLFCITGFGAVSILAGLLYVRKRKGAD